MNGFTALELYKHRESITFMIYCLQFLFFVDYNVEQIKEDEMHGTCRKHERRGGGVALINEYKILVGKLEGNRLLQRNRSIVYDVNTSFNLNKFGVEWTGFIWLKIVYIGGLLATYPSYIELSEEKYLDDDKRGSCRGLLSCNAV
jgi:hypothetical protein